jgi:hypothetical protein
MNQPNGLISYYSWRSEMSLNYLRNVVVEGQKRCMCGSYRAAATIDNTGQDIEGRWVSRGKRDAGQGPVYLLADQIKK